MHTAGKLVGLTTIAVLAATAAAAPAVDVKARQAATPFGFPLPTDPFFGLNFGFAGAPLTNGQTATASSTPVASAVPEKRQFFPFIPLSAFGIDGIAGLGDAAGTGSAVESTTAAAPSSAPAKRQFFPFLPYFDPEEFGAGESSGSGGAGAGAGAGAGSSVSNATVPASGGAPEKRQFFPFVDPFLIPLEEFADNARPQTTNATVPVATDAI